MQNTIEKGVHFIEHQILQPRLICASSLVNCENFAFPCLMVNLTDKPICITTDHKLEKPPTMMHKQEFKNQTNRIKRLQLLNENLRLNHIVEGADEIRGICEEYVLLVPRNFSRGRGVIPSLAERGGAVSSADVSVGTTSLECSVLECGQVYSMLCC
jgi:uncharacterized protein YpiB (UPF0302 family)